MKYLIFSLMLFMPWAFADDSNVKVMEIFITDGSIGQIVNRDLAKRQEYQIIVYNLDDGERFNQTLSKGLSKDPAVAKQQVASIAGKIDPNEVAHAFGPVIKASLYGVKKQPAIVFDNGRSVIYGITDLSVAIAMKSKWQNQQK